MVTGKRVCCVLCVVSGECKGAKGEECVWVWCVMCSECEGNWEECVWCVVSYECECNREECMGCGAW